MKSQQIILLVVGAVVAKRLILEVVAQRVASGIVREAGSNAPEVRRAADAAGKAFASSLGVSGAARLAFSKL